MTRWRLVVLVGSGAVAVLLGSAVTAWKLPYSGQGRADRPVFELVLREPPRLDGPWRPSVVDNGWEARGSLAELGVEQTGTSTWQRADGLEVDESVQRYTSASLAGWYFAHRDPGQRELDSSGHPEGFDEVVAVHSGDARGGADEARYFCGRTSGNPGACDARWVWLRYGQYIVQLQVSNGPSPGEDEPLWLRTMAHDAGTALNDRAARQ